MASSKKQTTTESSKMSTEMTLDELAALAGDDEGFDMGRAPTKKLKMETTYPVKIMKQEVTTSEKSGYYVAKFTLGVINADGSISDGDTVIQCLPTFSDAVRNSGDPEKLSQLKKNWGNGLQGILRAVHPAEFNTYAKSEKTANGKWKFYAEDGHEMSQTEKKAREQQVSKAVVGVALAMLHEQYSIVGTTCYFVWAPNKKDASNPYANFWSVAPDKYPLAE